MQTMEDLHVSLPETKEFMQANLDFDATAVLDKLNVRINRAKNFGPTRGLEPQPPDYKSGALPVAPRRQGAQITQSHCSLAALRSLLANNCCRDRRTITRVVALRVQ